MPNSAFTPSVLTLASATSGSGSGEINAVLNPSAAADTTGWTGATRVSSGSPLDPIVTTAFSISNAAGAESSTSGGYYSIASLASGLRNKKLKVEFYFTTPATDIYKVSVYKAGTRVPLTTDSSGSTSLPQNTTGKFVAYFDTDSSAAYSVNVTRISGTAGPCLITQVVVGPGIQPQGAVVGEWQSYAPTVSPITGFASSGGPLGQYRRIGANMEVQIAFKKNTSAGTGGTLLLGIPSGFTIDTSKFPQTASTQPSLGTANGFNILTLSQYDRALSVMYITGNTTAVGIIKPATSNFIAGTDVLANGEFNASFTVPIAEWAGSGTVQLAQNDVEYAYNTSGVTAAGATNTTSFGYGPAGAAIGAINSTTQGSSFTSMRVRFQTPVQASDLLILEVDNGQNQWTPMASRNPWIINNAAIYGAKIAPVSGSQTDFDVYFGNSGSEGAGALTYGASGNTWSNITNGRWRVRKSSAGAAVGFGLVAQSSAGLMPASNSNLDDATATRLGLKQYLHGGSYFGGLAPTVSAGTNVTNVGTVRRAVFIPYQCQDGTWRLRFTIRVDGATSASNTEHNIAVNGILTKNVTTWIQMCTGGVDTVIATGTFMLPNSNQIRIDTAAASTPTVYNLSGDVELETRPTWAYS